MSLHPNAQIPTPAPGWWTCAKCKALVPSGAAHFCGQTSIPPTPTQKPMVIGAEERIAAALERIASALERQLLHEHPGADTTHHDTARANPQDQTVKGEGPGAL